MARTLKRMLVLGVATGLLLSLGLPTAHAVTLVVDDDGKATPTNCGANVTTFSSIQAAVDAAAPGSAIKVCPGTYPESVSVPKTLIIRGAKAGVDARTRSTSGESIVDPPGPDQNGFNFVANNVVLDGFTVQGAVGNASGVRTDSGFSGYRILNNILKDNTFGLYAHNGGGAQMEVRRNLLKDNNEPGASAGNGIYSDQGAQNLLISANRILRNENSGILFADANPSLVTQSNIVIRNNRAVDNGNFLAMWDTQDVQVLSNRTDDTNNTDDFLSTIFIGARDDDVLIQGNVIRNAPFSGVAVRDRDGSTNAVPASVTDIDIRGNRIRGGEGSGIDVTASAPDAVDIRNNTLRFNDIDGIFMGADTNGNLIQGNTALENVNFDCEDDSTGGTGTAGTDNTWVSNIGEDADPAAICDPPS